MGPGIERWPCAHKDPDMRVHGTTPRARSAVHTSLIRAGVKPLYAEPGQERGAQQRTNRVHRNWTGNLVACPTNLVPRRLQHRPPYFQPSLPSTPVHRPSALLDPLLLRPFPRVRPIYRVQRSAQYPSRRR